MEKDSILQIVPTRRRQRQYTTPLVVEKKHKQKLKEDAFILYYKTLRLQCRTGSCRTESMQRDPSEATDSQSQDATLFQLPVGFNDSHRLYQVLYS
jgi:hypothetical protein